MSMFTIPSDRTPTWLVVWAAARLVHEFDLPEQIRVGELLAGGDLAPAFRLGRFYGHRVATESIAGLGKRSEPEPYPVMVLAIDAVDTATLLWPIRQAALGAGTASLDDRAWHLLVFAAALAAVRGKAVRLREWVIAVAGEIDDITTDTDSNTDGEGGE